MYNLNIGNNLKTIYLVKTKVIKSTDVKVDPCLI